MKETTQTLFETNQNTQPSSDYEKFMNWDFIAKGWYLLLESKKLKKAEVQSIKICGHRLSVFRTKTGNVGVVDSFCPHMGMDLAQGKVVGENLRCHFHHWDFDTSGKCTKIPALEKLPCSKKIDVKSYPVEEKYGFIWVYNDEVAPHGVYEVDEYKGKEVMFTHLKPFVRIAHPHITMMNSIDEQHMRTVHLIEIDLKLKTKEEGTMFQVDFEGVTSKDNWLGKAQALFVGDTWKSRVQLIDGCMGILSTMMDSKFLNRFKLPAGHFMFSQYCTEKGETHVCPIVVTEKRKGIFGFIFSKLYLQFLKICMWFLAYQDGRVIYGHLRFTPSGLLQGVDNVSAQWISFVNKNIPHSIWSRSKRENSQESFIPPKNKDNFQDHKLN